MKTYARRAPQQRKFTLRLPAEESLWLENASKAHHVSINKLIQRMILLQMKKAKDEAEARSPVIKEFREVGQLLKDATSRIKARGIV